MLDQSRDKDLILKNRWDETVCRTQLLLIGTRCTLMSEHLTEQASRVRDWK